MQYEFLEQFTRRMQHVGKYAVLMRMSMNKQTWKQYGFETFDEQVNILFAVLLFIMEQSLKDENCTVDDIGAYIDDLNSSYFHKQINYEECRDMADFIINVILSNDGQSMTFDGYDFESRQYKELIISYVKNKVIYTDTNIKRTSYELTNDGYDLMLSTLEIEDNLKLSVQDMIFELHLKKQSYDEAVNDIRNEFNLLHIRLRKIEDAMTRIRRNALSYSIDEYSQILNDNLETISETKEKFQARRKMIQEKTREFEEADIDVNNLSSDNEKTLENLRIIDDYLGRALEEQQKIFGSHLDLKALYTHELEQLSQMSAIKRFSLTADFYDKILKNPGYLDRTDIFLRPLFGCDPDKVYDLRRALATQKPITEREETDESELMEEDIADQDKKQEEIRRKLRIYEKSVRTLLKEAVHGKIERLKRGVAGSITLKELEEKCRSDLKLKKAMIPDVDKFKEIMVDLLNSRVMDIEQLDKERKENIQEEPSSFSLTETVLEIADSVRDRKIFMVEALKIDDGSTAVFTDIPDLSSHPSDDEDSGRDICCSNVLIRVRWEDR